MVQGMPWKVYTQLVKFHAFMQPQSSLLTAAAPCGPTSRSSKIISNQVLDLYLLNKGNIFVDIKYYNHCESSNFSPWIREHSPYWKASSHSVSQKIPYLLWNPKVHCHVYKSLPLVPGQMNAISLTSYFSKIKSNIILPTIYVGLPSGLFPSVFLSKILYEFLISRMRATWQPHHP